jgi:hypothetical protein
MDIDVPLRELGEVDTAPLHDAILAQEEAAWPNPEIRKEPGWDREDN